MTSENLKEYIRRIYLLESEVYTQNQLYGQVENLMWQLEQVPESRLEEKRHLEPGTVESLLFCGIILVLGGIFSYVTSNEVIKQLVFLLGCFFIVCLFIVLGQYGKIAIENARIVARNRKAIVANDQTRKMNLERCQELRMQFQTIERHLKETRGVLDTFYQRGIIYPKYRNLVAISSFYEYLSSGRCCTLEGHEGAYNIFETEIRLNMIVMKLDEVIARLEEIRDSQYMLYSAIQEGNAQARKMYTAIENIQDNTANTAYYSKMTAQNTQFLKWAEYLRA